MRLYVGRQSDEAQSFVLTGSTPVGRTRFGEWVSGLNHLTANEEHRKVPRVQISQSPPRWKRCSTVGSLEPIRAGEHTYDCHDAAVHPENRNPCVDSG